jgi:hypothetical protein
MSFRQRVITSWDKYNIELAEVLENQNEKNFKYGSATALVPYNQCGPLLIQLIGKIQSENVSLTEAEVYSRFADRIKNVFVIPVGKLPTRLSDAIKARIDISQQEDKERERDKHKQNNSHRSNQRIQKRSHFTNRAKAYLFKMIRCKEPFLKNPHRSCRVRGNLGKYGKKVLKHIVLNDCKRTRHEILSQKIANIMKKSRRRPTVLGTELKNRIEEDKIDFLQGDDSGDSDDNISDFVTSDDDDDDDGDDDDDDGGRFNSRTPVLSGTSGRGSKAQAVTVRKPGDSVHPKQPEITSSTSAQSASGSTQANGSESNSNIDSSQSNGAHGGNGSTSAPTSTSTSTDGITPSTAAFGSTQANGSVSNSTMDSSQSNGAHGGQSLGSSGKSYEFGSASDDDQALSEDGEDETKSHHTDHFSRLTSAEQRK